MPLTNVRRLRIATRIQLAVLGTIALLGFAFALFTQHRDSTAARAGHPNEWAGLGELLGTALGITTLVGLFAATVGYLTLSLFVVGIARRVRAGR